MIPGETTSFRTDKEDTEVVTGGWKDRRRGWPTTGWMDSFRGHSRPLEGLKYQLGTSIYGGNLSLWSNCWHQADDP